MKITSLLFPFILFIFSPSSPAATLPIESNDVRWPVVVDTLFQLSGESENQFVLRAAIVMDKFTRKTSFEASGNICRNSSGRLGMRVFTWNAHFSAPSTKACPLETPILKVGGFMHSHPLPGSYTLTQKDVEVVNEHRRFFKVTEKTRFRVSVSSAQFFSKNDYQIGPGYLVANGNLFHQTGYGSSMFVVSLYPRQIPVDVNRNFVAP